MHIFTFQDSHLSNKIPGFLFLPPATKLGQGYIFTGVCDSVNRGGGVHGRGGMWQGEACVAGGHAWQGACMAEGGPAWLGGMCGKGGHAWQRGACMAKGACVAKGGMHGKGGACMARGACMAKGAMHGERGCMAKGGMCGMHTPLYEIWPVNAWVVCILLECILVFKVNFQVFLNIN